LAAIARLHGIPATLPSQCRLLEVGCGEGANLLPCALAYPNSTFVGVDLSKSAISRGKAYQQQLGLANLHLEAADLTAWQPPEGAYDFIIAHGFYSWVPMTVRDALLALCRDRLAPAGIAYISYNALPGCHVRRMLWEMLRFHTRDIQEPNERIEQAVSLLQFLAAGTTAKGPYGEILRTAVRDAEELANRSVLFHDDLSDINDPVSITDFMSQAGRFGFEFLAEADYFEMTADLLPKPVADTLAGLAERNYVLKEQYFDFLKMRRFRQTLLCRKGALKSRRPLNHAVYDLSITSDAEPNPGPADLTAGVDVQFRAVGGAAATFDHPLIKAAFVVLRQAFPFPLTFMELIREAARVSEHQGNIISRELAANLAHALADGYRYGLVELLADPPRFGREVSDKPKLSPLARLQLEQGMEMLTSLRPSIIRMENPISREMLRLLDGTRDRAELLDGLVERASRDSKFLKPGDTPKTKEWWREKIEPQLDQGLVMAVKNGLLAE
jgi:methyltransferase-like protein/SAM-dependent methyltransferase